MQIHWAAKRGDTLAVERQLRRGVDVNARDEEGKTPLMYTCDGRARVATLQLLVEHGADVNAVGGMVESTPLLLAANSGSPEKVRFLLAAGADPRFVNPHGYTAITSCIALRDAGRLAILEILLEAGTDPNVVSKFGECALRSAVATGQFQAVRLLLAHNASRDPAKMTDLMWVIALGTAEDVAAELRRGGKLSSRNFWDMTPWLLSLLTGDVRKAELLLNSGATFDDQGRCGKTNLMYPVSCDHVEMTQWLLSRGADIHATDEFGQYALQMAVEAGAARCIQILLEAGVQLEARRGDPVITHARNAEVVRVLMNAGADIDAVDECGYWLLKHAAETGNYEFARELIELGANPNTTSTGDTVLHMAATWDHLEIAALLIQHGADPNRADVDGWTPLMRARSLECIELLLTAGANIDATDEGGADVIEHHEDIEILDRLRSAGATLHSKPGSLGSLFLSAAKDGNLDLIEYLARNRVDVNAPNVWGLTALMAAADRGHAEVVSRLLESGSDPHASDENGRTALFYATAPEAFTAFQLTQELSLGTQATVREYLPNIRDDWTWPSLDFGYRPSDEVTCIDLLVDAGAGIESRDADGATPLLVACRCGRPTRVAKLLQLGADVRARDYTGRSVRELAAEHHDPQQRDRILALLEAPD